MTMADPAFLGGRGGGAVSYVGAGAAVMSSGVATPASVAVPGGVAAGDLLLLFASTRSAVTTIDTPAGGWALVDVGHWTGGLSHIAAFWKIAGEGEASASVVFSATSAQTFIAQMCAFRGTHQSTPIIEVGTLGDFASALDIGPIPGLTLASKNAVVIVGHRSQEWISVADLAGDGLTWAEIGEPSTTLGGDAGVVSDYAINDTGGAVAVSDKTFAVTATENATSIGIMIELGAA